jgi:hypothetical protein
VKGITRRAAEKPLNPFAPKSGVSGDPFRLARPTPARWRPGPAASRAETQRQQFSDSPGVGHSSCLLTQRPGMGVMLNTQGEPRDGQRAGRSPRFSLALFRDPPPPYLRAGPSVTYTQGFAHPKGLGPHMGAPSPLLARCRDLICH